MRTQSREGVLKSLPNDLSENHRTSMKTGFQETSTNSVVIESLKFEDYLLYHLESHGST